jgi:2-polyprenyl-6-methoxyphenol hydroxylase-like FAD-dependent oxidoreductase
MTTTDTNSAAHYDIVVIGGGMVGAALACAAALRDLRIAVVDGHPPQRVCPRVRWTYVCRR